MSILGKMDGSEDIKLLSKLVSPETEFANIPSRNTLCTVGDLRRLQRSSIWFFYQMLVAMFSWARLLLFRFLKTVKFTFIRCETHNHKTIP